MMFDWTVNFGNIIQIAVILGSWVWMFLSMKTEIRLLRNDVGHLEHRQNSLNEAFTQLGTILTQVAVQDSRLSMIEKNVDELRHGQGFVTR